ncbi:hypothetical protein Fcan01_20205 [Folsomia candida]|uniref:Uncharacterized protein n=1 Tax=Folsomia candida TaxID=158441 RepID=A0A226DJI1_FOLCA|nr:hypothetical protein Fcan01_20205 [Folsomia candida]
MIVNPYADGNIKAKDKVEADKDKKDPEFTQQVKGHVHLLQLMQKSTQNALKELEDPKVKTAKLIPVDEYIRAQNKDDSISKAELQEAEESGLIGFIEVVNKPTPWWTWFTVVSICLIEVTVGALLASFTGGVLGMGLVVDAITIGIMVATCGLGLIVARFSGKIATFAAKWGNKFLETDIGLGFKTMFEDGQRVWSGLKGIVKTIGKGDKEFFEMLWRNIRNLGTDAWDLVKLLGIKINKFWETIKPTRAWEFLVSAKNKLKLPEALKYVTDSFKTVREFLGKLATWIRTSISEPFITRVTPQSLRAQQAAFTVKLVAKEFARRGALEGLDWILNSKLMPLLKSLIAKELRKYVIDSVTKEVTDGWTGTSMGRYLGNYTSKQSYETALRRMKNEKLIKIVQDELVLQHPTVEKSLISALLSCADKAAEKLRIEKDKQGPAVKLAKVIENWAQLFVDLYRTVGVVTSIVKYTDHLFSRFRTELDESNQPDPTDASYIKNPVGKTEYESDKKKLIDELATQIADQMADIIVQGIIVPKTQQKMSEIVSNMKVFKNKDVLEKLGEIQKGLGHPERFPQASIWDIYKGRQKNRDAEHAETVEEGVHLLAPALSTMSEIAGQSIEVYNQADYELIEGSNHEEPALTIVSCTMAPGHREEEPIRVAMYRLDYRSTWQYVPVVRGSDGVLRMIPTPMADGDNLMESVALMSKADYTKNLINLKYIESLY